MNGIIKSFLNLRGMKSENVMMNDKMNIDKLLKNHNTTINNVTDNELVKILLCPSVSDFKNHHKSTIKSLQKYTSIRI